MKNKSDKLSNLAANAINFLFINHPTRTSLGVILGLVICFLTELFSPLLNQLAIINFAIIKAWQYIAVGIFLMHMRTFYDTVIKKTYLGENEEKAFELIRLSKEQGKITDWEAKNLYIKLCERVLANVELKEVGEKEFKPSLLQ